jgi:demethylmenaquinone methyltransferase/2-methoxy-6-polyprenyl-1,4-benzoquinol methylase
MQNTEQVSRIRSIFGGTAPFYDEIVDEATQGADRAWKERMLGKLGQPRRVLDLSCGTGILLFMIRDRLPAARVVGLDISEEYLERARARAHERRDDAVDFVHGAAEELDVPDGFDAVTSCYLPKYANLPVLVSRLGPKLERGARLVMQDFDYPEREEVRAVWEARFEALRLWARRSRPEAERMMTLLPGIIRESRWSRELPDLLVREGFSDVATERLSFGTSTIVSAVWKPAPAPEPVRELPGPF